MTTRRQFFRWLPMLPVAMATSPPVSAPRCAVPYVVGMAHPDQSCIAPWHFNRLVNLVNYLSLKSAGVNIDRVEYYSNGPT